MKIKIDVLAMSSGSDYETQYKTIGSADLEIDVPDNVETIVVGDALPFAIAQAIILHNTKLADLGAKKMEEKEDQADADAAREKQWEEKE